MKERSLPLYALPFEIGTGLEREVFDSVPSSVPGFINYRRRKKPEPTSRRFKHSGKPKASIRSQSPVLLAFVPALIEDQQ